MLQPYILYLYSITFCPQYLLATFYDYLLYLQTNQLIRKNKFTINFYIYIFLNYLRFIKMKSKLLFTLFGIGVGATGHYAYKYYNPERNITKTSNEMIHSYIVKHELEQGYLVNVLKSVGLMLKGFYHYGMDTKIQGFNYNSTYVKKGQVRDDNVDVKHLYCIFSPTDYLCGHPEIQHGGATATIIDQNMGYLAILHSKEMVATADLHVKYKKPVKKDQFYVLETEVTGRQGRKIWVKGTIRQLQTGQVKVESQALFFTVNWQNQMSRILSRFFQVIKYKDYKQHHNDSIQKQGNASTSQNLLSKQKINKIKEQVKKQPYIDHELQSKLQKLQKIIQQLESKEQLIAIPPPESSNIYQQGRTS